MDSSKTVKVVLTLDNGQFITSLQASGREHSTFAANVVRSGQAMDATLKSGEMSAKQTAAALRMLPAQFTDIFTGLASGQAPMTVLIQQGGQLKDSFGGVAPAARAMGGYIAGLVSPTMLAAGAAGALAVAYYQGSKEADAYTRSIVMSGNAAGATVGQMQAAARGASAVVGTQAAAADAVAQLGATGQVAARNLEGFTATALRMEREVGQAVEKTAEQFSGLGDKPVQASLKLNESYGYLTTAIYEQIRALEASGKHHEAGELAQRSFAAAMDERTNRLRGNLGLLERGWRAIGDAAGWAWNKMLNVGRKETVADQLSKAQQELQDRMSRGPTNDVPGVRGSWEKGNERMRENIRLLQEKVKLEEESAAAAAKSQAQEKAGIEWSQRAYEARSKSKKMEDELAAARQQFKDAGKDEVRDKKELDAVLAGIRDKYKESTTEQNKAAKEQERQLALMAELGGLSSTFYKDWTELNKQFAAGKIKQEELVRLQATLLAKQPAMAAAAREEQKALDAQVRAWQELERVQERAREKALEALQKSAQGAEQQVQKLLDEEHATTLAAVANISLAEAVERVALARAQEAYQKAAAAGADGQTLLALQKEIEAREKIVSLTGAREAREALKKTADEASKELKRVTEQYEQGLTNAAMQGGKSLKEYIQGVLRTTAFRIVLQPVMNWGAQLLTAITGGAGGAGGASALLGGSGGLMGTVGNLGSLASLLGGNSMLGNIAGTLGGWLGLGGAVSTGTGIATSVGTGLSLTGTTGGLGLTTGGGLGLTVGNTASSAVSLGGAGAGASGATSTLMAAAPYAAIIAAAVAVASNMWEQGWTRDALKGEGKSTFYGGAGSYMTGIGVLEKHKLGVLSALGVSEKWADILSGTTRMALLFGRKLKDSGLEATLGSNADGGSESRQYAFYKGGLFRSDKTTYVKTDEGVEAYLDNAVTTARAALRAVAESLDAPTAALDTFALTVKESFKDLSEEEANDKLAEIVGRYAEGLGGAFLEGLDGSGVAAWVQRIAKDGGTAAERLQAIADYPAQLLQSIGTTREDLVRIFTEGLVNGDAAAAGQAVADQLVASIELSMLSGASAQVFDIVNRGIVTPILDAMANGASLSEAISQANIARTVAKAQETAAAFAAVWNDPGFKQAMESIRTTVGSALGTAGGALQYQPTYIRPQAAVDAGASSSASQEETPEDRLRKKIQDMAADGAQLAADLLRAKGDEAAAALAELEIATEGVTGVLREQYIAQRDANQAMQGSIAAWEAIGALKDEGAGLAIELLRAQGHEAAAALRQFEAATAKMTEAEREAYRLQQQANDALRAQIALATELPALLARFMTPQQSQAAGYGRIAQGLEQAGIHVGADTLAQASLQQIAQAAAEIYHLGSTSDATRLALVRAVASLAELKDAATASANAAADAALSALSRSIEAEKAAITEAANARIESLRQEAEAQKAAQDTASEALATATRIADTLGRAVRALRGQVESAVVQDLAAARAFIEGAARAAAATGALPDEEQLARAIESVTADQQQRYGTYADWEAAQLDQANQLAALEGVSTAQMTVAERHLAATKAQAALLEEQVKATQAGAAAAIRALDQQLAAAQERLAVLRDSNAQLQSIATATAGFEAALAQLAQALAASAKGPSAGGGGPSGGAPTPAPGGASTVVLNGPGGSQYDARSDVFYAAGTGMPYLGASLGAAAIDMVNAGHALQVYQAAVAGGVTSQMLAQWTGASAADLNAWAAANNLPAFAEGTNYVPRDMIALIHEGEEIVPKRYNPAAQAGAWTSASTISRSVASRGAGSESALQAVVATLAGTVGQLAGGAGEGALGAEDRSNLRRIREVLEGAAMGRVRLGVAA
ncbi:Phage-related minor tail protein [Oryzisolibacter propanilivorax]|uniref:Phage-related minor tail protein n=1 Tax=Oryzisolibacter propanilivorax TaxID=1527607 RepID=A0A1G9UBV8_9BURK|nr:phage tail length tape measure family protein [Oryzisolibacter propanilivorax]SDM57389.1 Phage-related minor tail protein [Oryzisolibacter propanilivorax]